MHISGEKQVDLLTGVVNFLFSIQKHLTPIKEINNPNISPCIYAMWHGNQCCVFGIPNKNHLHILISKSVDGEIIARATEKIGFKTVRGSKGKKGSVEATMQMIDLLKSGENVAITVDGPRGPAKNVKDGVIKIAKLSGAPIVPVAWYSPDINLLKFPSWDEFRYPFGYTRLVNLYGEPIYVDKDGSKEDDEAVRIKLQESLLELDEKIPQAWKDSSWTISGWWKSRNEKNN